jgi:hypothetical protein
MGLHEILITLALGTLIRPFCAHMRDIAIHLLKEPLLLAMQERGLCNTLEEGCHPAGHNTSHGELFVSLDKVSLASRIGNGNFGEVCHDLAP